MSYEERIKNNIMVKNNSYGEEVELVDDGKI